MLDLYPFCASQIATDGHQVGEIGSNSAENLSGSGDGSGDVPTKSLIVKLEERDTVPTLLGGTASSIAVSTESPPPSVRELAADVLKTQTDASLHAIPDAVFAVGLGGYRYFKATYTCYSLCR